jgi:hypothetical protein
MKELTCLECESKNPAGTEICYICGASLQTAGDLSASLEHSDITKQIQKPGTGELQGVPDHLVGDDLPDWLDVEEIAEEEAVETIEESEPIKSEDVPDWLMEPDEFDLDKALNSVLDDQNHQPISDASEEIQVADSSGIQAIDTEGEPKIEEISRNKGEELPLWMRPLDPGQVDVDRATLSAESAGPLAGLRGVLHISPLIAEPDIRPQHSRFEMTKEQKQQLALLGQITAAETMDEAPEDSVKPKQTMAFQRLALSGAMLLLIVLGWLLPSYDELLPESMIPDIPRAASSTFSSVNTAAGKPILVAFEYSPAMAGELDVVAETLLRQVANNNSPVITMSQFAAGTAIAQQVTGQVEGLSVESLGFVPGEATGLRRLGSCIADAKACESIFGKPLDQQVVDELTTVALVIVLTSERDSLVNWIEQVGTQDDTVLVAGITQSLGPLSGPYLASEQLGGAVEGAAVAALYERSIMKIDGDAGELFTGVILTEWLAIFALVAGGLYFGLDSLAPHISSRIKLR